MNKINTLISNHSDLLLVAGITLFITIVGYTQWKTTAPSESFFYTQALKESKKLTSPEDIEDYLIDQSKKFLYYNLPEDAYILSSYILENIDKNSYSAKRIIEQVSNDHKIDKKDIMYYMISSRYKYL